MADNWYAIYIYNIYICVYMYITVYLYLEFARLPVNTSGEVTNGHGG